MSSIYVPYDRDLRIVAGSSTPLEVRGRDRSIKFSEAGLVVSTFSGRSELNVRATALLLYLNPTLTFSDVAIYGDALITTTEEIYPRVVYVLLRIDLLTRRRRRRGRPC